MENKQDNSAEKKTQLHKAADPNKQLTNEAHTQADKDMEEYAALTASSANDDLDETESRDLQDDTKLV